MKRQPAWANGTFLRSKEAEQGSGSWHHCRACSRTFSLGCSGLSEGAWWGQVLIRISIQSLEPPAHLPPVIHSLTYSTIQPQTWVLASILCQALCWPWDRVVSMIHMPAFTKPQPSNQQVGKPHNCRTIDALKETIAERELTGQQQREGSQTRPFRSCM